MGNPGSDERGRAWSPALPGPAPPRLLEDLSVRSWVPSVLSPCKNGSGRKWLNPMYFYTQQPPGRSGRIIRSSCVWGGMRYVWGKGLNTKRVARSHTHTGTGSSLCQLQAEVTALGFCRGAKLLENTTENKSPAKNQGRVAPLWASSGAFSGHSVTGDAGDHADPFSNFSSYICFGSPLVSPGPPPPGAQTSRSLASQIF